MGIVWGRPIMTVFVRPVTVCVPNAGKLKDELVTCGSSSGRSVDKFKQCAFTAARGKLKDTVIIEECRYFYECHIVQKNKLDPQVLDAGIIKDFYPARGFGITHRV